MAITGFDTDKVPSMGIRMRSRSVICACLGIATSLMATTAVFAKTVVVPDPSPQAFIFFGAGDASVTYDGVTFSQSASLSNGFFFNVGSGFSGDPAVLSSQQQTTGVANILVSFPSPTNNVIIDYGTFDTGSVTFALSTGQSFVEPGTNSGYLTPGVFSITEPNPFTSVLVTDADLVHIQSVSYDIAAIPEPNTWVMMLLGVGGLGAAMRFSRRHRLVAVAAA